MEIYYLFNSFNKSHFNIKFICDNSKFIIAFKTLKT